MFEKKNKTPVEVVVLLDSSGSMYGLQKAVVSGFNELLEGQKMLPGKANLSLITFDSEYKVVMDSQPLDSVKPMQDSDFVPKNQTALYDALGFVLTSMLEENPEKAIICIMTDGMENASKEYSQEHIKTLVKQAEDKGWKLQYVGANQDSILASRSLGIVSTSGINFSANAAGAEYAYNSLGTATTSYRNS